MGKMREQHDRRIYGYFGEWQNNATRGHCTATTYSVPSSAALYNLQRRSKHQSILVRSNHPEPLIFLFIKFSLSSYALPNPIERAHSSTSSLQFFLSPPVLPVLFRGLVSFPLRNCHYYPDCCFMIPNLLEAVTGRGGRQYNKRSAVHAV